MWRRLDLVWTDVSVERIASIFRAEKSVSRWPPDHAGSSRADFSTLKMEAIRFSEKSVQTRSTRGHNPEDGIFSSIKSACIYWLMADSSSKIMRRQNNIPNGWTIKKSISRLHWSKLLHTLNENFIFTDTHTHTHTHQCNTRWETNGKCHHLLYTHSY
jgi:hypothetical protein